MRRSTDPLTHWLSLTWDRPERSYNPEIRDFLASLLSYPTANVITEDSASGGYPDLKLVGSDGMAWVVGDLKKEDTHLTLPARRTVLWAEKRKYVSGLTRYVLFLTAHFLWITLANGDPVDLLPEPLDLRLFNVLELKEKLSFINYAMSAHQRQWEDFTEGIFPFSYLPLDQEESVQRLQYDLRTGFYELQNSASKAITMLQDQYNGYVVSRKDIERNLVGFHETQQRARMRLELEFSFVRRLFEEDIPQFEAQYGRDIEKADVRHKRIIEAFIADSVAALMARILFLRLVEDLRLTQKRRLSNGGPRNWTAFVEYLTGDARALVRVASEDVACVYKEPFAHTVFDWIHFANGELDIPLQRLILRFNAYDFSGLSEEIIGDIYQQFLPPQKRKQLGEYYTPTSIVDWILDQTARSHSVGTLLDPSCGSGSFLVRYAHWRFEDAAQRRLNPGLVRTQVQEEVWGFDLNPFAAFISLFQITWALLRHHASGPAPHVHIYNLNSLLQDRDIAPFVGEDHLGPGALERDSRKWRYIVGNPPYIRAERVKYGSEMRKLWEEVWDQNSDTGLVFLFRAVREWLEPDGFLGMVVSGGYANSSAAAKVWNLLQPGKECALRKIVWLEFVGKVWDANVIPMILIIERTEAKPEDMIELHVPSEWPSSKKPIHVKYSDFFDSRINPKTPNGNGSKNGNGSYGDYLLPLLQSEDIAVLKKLYPDGEKIIRLGDVTDWTYGVQRGGVEMTDEPTGERPIRIIAGRSLAVAWPGEAAGWVDLSEVKKRPNGKLSLWKEPVGSSKFIAVGKFGLALFASVVITDGTIAGLDTTTIAGLIESRLDVVCYLKRPEAVAALLNSKLIRFIWAVRLRSGVLAGSSRATIYPRSLAALPWPAHITLNQEQALAEGYENLARLARRAKDSPNEWLLAETERQLAVSHRSVTDPLFGLTFEEGEITVLPEEFLLHGKRLQTESSLFAEVNDPLLAHYLYRILLLTAKDDQPITPFDAQRLLVPSNYAALMQEYQARDVAFQSVEKDFLEALSISDDIVYEVFGMEGNKAYIEERLASFPLNRLKPRYPWEIVRPRPIKSYMADRFN